MPDRDEEKYGPRGTDARKRPPYLNSPEPIDGKIQYAVVLAAGIMVVLVVLYLLGSWLVDGVNALF